MESDALRTLVLIVSIAVLSPFISDLAKRWTRIPGVVIEIALGMVIGPHVLGWAHLDEVIDVLAEMGLVFLIFLAGFEIDPDEVKGRPVRLAVQGWMVSLALGIVVAVALHALDVTSGIRFVAIALTTTAIGTLLPILGDAGVLQTKLGANFLASGAMGELGPIVAISVALTSDTPGRTTVVLLVFVAIALLVGWLATRDARPRTVALIARTLHSSGQLGVRICVLLCLLLVWTAAEFGLDVLLGAFAAGMVARLFLVQHSSVADAEAAGHASVFDHREEVQHRIEALGFGFFIPLFFVVSGANLDIDSIIANPVPLIRFFIYILIARGVTQYFLYRRAIPERRERARFALLVATGLPMIVAVTSIEVDAGVMIPSNAAALVGAGALTVLVFPLLGTWLVRRSPSEVQERAENTA